MKTKLNCLMKTWALLAVATVNALISNAHAQGPFINGRFIKAANLPWLDGQYDHDIGTSPLNDYPCAYNSAHMNQYLAALHALGITVVRLWLNEDEQGLVLDASGNVTGLQPVFLANLDDIVQRAGQNQIQLYLTLNEGVSAPWVGHPALQASYVQNAVGPLAARYLGNTHIFAFDTANEIDGVTYPVADGGGGATWAQAQNYVQAVATAIHTADPTRLVSSSVGYYPAWSALTYVKGLGLDFYDFHDYEDTPSFPTASSLNAQYGLGGKPIFIGEYGQALSPPTSPYTDAVQSANALSMLNSAYNGGFAGAEIWSYQYPGATYDLLPMVNPDGTPRPVCAVVQNWSPPPPSISSIPSSGTVGTYIVITGANFTNATAVSFNGTPAVYTVISATEIAAVVPLASTSGPITVSSPDGVAQSSSSFTVAALPANLPAFTTLASFDLTNVGAYPTAGLILAQGILYGTTSYLETTNTAFPTLQGTVFAVSLNGANLRPLCVFTNYVNGQDPGPLSFSGGTLYGSTRYGSNLADGTLFALSPSGAEFTDLFTFNALADGSFPSGVILSGSTLYGTAESGGTGPGHSTAGVVFAINTNGTPANVYNFTNGSDGGRPLGGVILSGNILYGTASTGGAAGNGTVFKVNTDGTGFATLHSFTAINNNANSDGADPGVGLILSGSTLYGTANGGGAAGNGTIFAVQTNGMDFVTLHSFSAGQTNLLRDITNSDGTGPLSGLLLSGNMLYGTAGDGGTAGNGTVFAVQTNGANFTTLHNFTALTPGSDNDGGSINHDGANPVGPLVLSGNTLYGTATQGGSTGGGTIFSLSLLTLSVVNSDANIVLTWPSNYTGFTLQSSTNLNTGVWSTVSTGPFVLGGLNTVTDAISGAQKFYRLSQ